MKLLNKYKKLIIVSIIFVMLTIYVIILVDRQYGNFPRAELVLGEEGEILTPIHLKIGEEYDLNDTLKAAKTKLDKTLLKQLDGAFSLTVSKMPVLERNGNKIKALECGTGTI
ncbi:MAG: hypothetical protein EOM87_05270, partial [Clostridia bacterium]|nr:hypothetical protein [Clostridia bacterium]